MLDSGKAHLHDPLQHDDLNTYRARHTRVLADLAQYDNCYTWYVRLGTETRSALFPPHRDQLPWFTTIHLHPQSLRNQDSVPFDDGRDLLKLRRWLSLLYEGQHRNILILVKHASWTSF